ncbi:hypothetical protein [Limnospira sp. PMC 289.06]|uniref:hypothetical protein n=1 Tax=Limnospira sp. PMC 289.06 TaxID=2981094 RepID=UPI0012CA93B3|nr:hypothetical protein [Arthrospira sp. PLM2.Bin9]MDT9181604.1 hypothetical protein [Limnospira sp. PMC 289.06]TVU54916.1 MAG: hypothetical protein EA414_04330 [Arthrospira sp. PLM2.Bin9]
MLSPFPPLIDERGIIRQAMAVFSEPQQLKFLAAIAELQNPQSYQNQYFPISRLKRLKGTQAHIYTVDIDPTSKWMFYIEYQNGNIYLRELYKPTNNHAKTSLDIIAEVNDF